MTPPQNLTHPDDGLVYACPDCDATGLWQRADERVACYACEPSTTHDLADCIEREPIGPSDAFEAQQGRGFDKEHREAGQNAKYSDLTLADVGLD